MLPLRTPGGYSTTVAHGFQLRVINGPQLAPDDPLLAAFGVTLAPVENVDEHDVGLQHEGFDPGRELQLTIEPDPDGNEVAGVWDAEQIRKAGTLPTDSSARAIAALEHGLTLRALALQEDRERPDDRRAGLTVLLFAENFVRLSRRGARPCQRTAPTRRRRVVLLADGSPEVRWWDNAVDGGPGEIGDLPLSPQLSADLTQLQEALRKVHKRMKRACDSYERHELDIEAAELDEQARVLWVGARAELARNYAVGFLGRGMDRPVWSPSDLDTARECAESVEN